MGSLAAFFDLPALAGGFPSAGSTDSGSGGDSVATVGSSEAIWVGNWGDGDLGL